MPISRVTQRMITNRSLSGLQMGLSRLAKSQEQLTTGRVLNRPSDSPTGTTAAMRMRAKISDQAQYQRNAQDGSGWLGQADTTLTSMLSQVRRARDISVQGVNMVSMGPGAREGLAAEVDQLRASMLSSANATYLDRPIFGGVVAGSTAYDATGTFVGVSGPVQRTIADGVKVTVNVDGPSVLGASGATVFDNLSQLSTALRAGDTAGIQAAMNGLGDAQSRITTALSDVGARANQVDRAIQASQDASLDLTSALSNVENVDLVKATTDMQLNQVAYQAALAATAKLTQPSLTDFLR
ncbi:MAG: flagellar hook-associated protein 3 FlgL [Nocardioidaceae bacterium]|jgi:flagellar hook-associated protein 3 FlgL|nr:flagellar hook-associated protein 3 FlgL [Nocardioidaceae bacterium]